MPFILITGIPSSGKTVLARQLQLYFTQKDISVKVISENDVLKEKNWTTDIYNDSRIEKDLRGILKSEYMRLVGPNNVLILDGLNYIKGFRYELYCASKTHRSTQCVIHCDPGPDTAWQYNIMREEQFQYDKKVFDGLVQRYEAPDNRNRWDSPLITLVDTKKIPFDDIHAVLFERKPPPPNQSTQCPPMSDTNFLHEVDKAVQAIVTSISSATKMGLNGEISVEGTSEKVLLPADHGVSLPNLLRLKRQFIVFVKSRSDLQSTAIPMLFVQYLNTNL